MQKGKALATCERLTLAKSVQSCSLQPAPKMFGTDSDASKLESSCFSSIALLHFAIYILHFSTLTPHEASSSLGVNWGSYFVSVARHLTRSAWVSRPRRVADRTSPLACRAGDLSVSRSAESETRAQRGRKINTCVPGVFALSKMFTAVGQSRERSKALFSEFGANHVKSAGRKTRSPIRAAAMVEQAMAAKVRWPGSSLVTTAIKPAMRIRVV